MLRRLFCFFGEALKRLVKRSVGILVANEGFRHSRRLGDIAHRTGIAGAAVAFARPGQPGMILADEPVALAVRAGARSGTDSA